MMAHVKIQKDGLLQTRERAPPGTPPCWHTDLQLPCLLLKLPELQYIYCSSLSWCVQFGIMRLWRQDAWLECLGLSKINKVGHWLKDKDNWISNKLLQQGRGSCMNRAQFPLVHRWVGVLKGEWGSRGGGEWGLSRVREVGNHKGLLSANVDPTAVFAAGDYQR